MFAVDTKGVSDVLKHSRMICDERFELFQAHASRLGPICCVNKQLCANLCRGLCGPSLDLYFNLGLWNFEPAEIK